jgi:hypothetical protein
MSPPLTGNMSELLFDVCLKVLIPGYQEPLYVFIDCMNSDQPSKSPHHDVEVDVDVEVDAPVSYEGPEKRAEALRNNPQQYHRLRNFAEEGGLDFLFIYQTAYDVPITSIGSEGNAILLGRNATMDFFGPVGEFYCTLREFMPRCGMEGRQQIGRK